MYSGILCHTLSDGGVNTLSTSKVSLMLNNGKYIKDIMYEQIIEILILTILVVAIILYIGYVIVLHSLPPMRY